MKIDTQLRMDNAYDAVCTLETNHRVRQSQELRTESYLGKKAAKTAKKEIRKTCSALEVGTTVEGNRRPALFDLSEIQAGKRLGKGGYSRVSEIVAFHPNPLLEGKFDLKQQAAREHIIKASQSQLNRPQYAIKILRSDLSKNPEKYVDAAVHLALEAQLMLAMDHPNILKLRGYAAAGVDGFTFNHKGYFLIVDKLQETLEDRLEAWRAKYMRSEKRSSSFLTSKKSKKALASLLEERLRAAHEIASALAYMHEEHSIVYRDLKSSNIGFDKDGHIKVFDFGLAKPITAETGHLVGSAGSRGYMAPEVEDKTRTYGLKADVFSFGVVLWEILAMVPRGIVNVENSQALPVCESWPMSLQKLLKSTLSSDPTRRPTMKAVECILQQALDGASS